MSTPLQFYPAFISPRLILAPYLIVFCYHPAPPPPPATIHNLYCHVQFYCISNTLSFYLHRFSMTHLCYALGNLPVYATSFGANCFFSLKYFTRRYTFHDINTFGMIFYSMIFLLALLWYSYFIPLFFLHYNLLLSVPIFFLHFDLVTLFYPPPP